MKEPNTFVTGIDEPENYDKKDLVKDKLTRLVDDID